MSFHGDLAAVLRGREFRKLFGTRIVSQLGDGVYQVALASYVFFNPEQHTTAPEVAVAFAVLLLPFSVVGPFAGVLIDRWSRRQVLLNSALLKAVLAVATALLVAVGSDGAPFLLAALVLLSINRFFLAGLSAALPHVVPREKLVMANAVTPTCGTFATFLGAGLGAGLRLLAGDGALGTSVIMVGAAALFLGAAVVTLTLGRGQLGPDLASAPDEVRAAVRNVAYGLIAGAQHIWRRPPARYGLATIAAHRFGFGLSTLVTLLLYNNTFTGGGVAGLAGFSVAMAASGAGFFVAAMATPWATERISKERWIAVLCGFGAGCLVAFALPFSVALFPVAGFALGVVSQGIKISVDTMIHHHVDDAFRGRVFSCYDMVFNAAFVAAAAVAALTVPPSGVAPILVLAMSLGYAVLCVCWLVRARGVDRAVTPSTTATVT
ncbi:MFS transporter [Lipingzhangella sp. LS1_29]|uniref:MFS transporter n=1 Tax=Lipingzhangella rawalii TaxID=2055835 RepID=A0ABU2H8X7_9ACTN|nr:MFS transporter [Lipingzhangella rawalii]MDS1271457.1 MFS transporter [Lipingzhangella rawalii]